jgi:ATP-binding cassette, subfamily B, vacuolar membrane transporter HMT1/ACLQ
VLKGGQIVEKGTHEGLLAKKDSMYAAMWNKQVKAEKAAENARNATLRAEKLLRKANIGSSEASGSGKHPSHPLQNEEASSSSDESTHNKQKQKADEAAGNKCKQETEDNSSSSDDDSSHKSKAKTTANA